MAVFKSTHTALTFAFNFDGTNVTTPKIGLPPPAGNGKGLGGLDGAAEAGNIKRIVHECGRYAENIAKARFMPKRLPCSCKRPCCMGWTPNFEWKSAVREIADEIQAVCFDGRNAYDYQARVVGRYFSKEMERENFADLADAVGFSERTVRRHFDQVSSFLHGNKTYKGSEQVVIERIDNALRYAGVVGEDDE